MTTFNIIMSIILAFIAGFFFAVIRILGKWNNDD